MACTPTSAALESRCTTVTCDVTFLVALPTFLAIDSIDRVQCQVVVINAHGLKHRFHHHCRSFRGLGQEWLQRILQEGIHADNAFRFSLASKLDERKVEKRL